MSIQGILYEKGRRVITVDRNEGIERAAELMHKHDIAALPVTDGSRVVGMLSSREIVDASCRAWELPFSSARLRPDAGGLRPGFTAGITETRDCPDVALSRYSHSGVLR